MKTKEKKAELVKSTLKQTKVQCPWASYFLKVDGAYIAFKLKATYESAKFIFENHAEREALLFAALSSQKSKYRG